MNSRLAGKQGWCVTIASALPDIGKGQEFGDATHGRAKRAVLDLLRPCG
jgi:hypothetical protein